MNRILLLGLTLIAAGAVAWVSLQPASQMRISDTGIAPMGGGIYMGFLTVTNDGMPDRLIAASAPDFADVHFMGARGPIIVPGGAAPSLAGDGVHLMLMGGEVATGTLVPVELEFATAGTISFRAKVGAGSMDHGAMSGVEVADMSVRLVTPDVAQRGGFSAQVEIDGLTLVTRAADAPYLDGEGHAHVYLNGLKLQRLYENSFRVGTLLPGQYVLRVSANTNDHRPYMSQGAPVADTWEFSVD